MSASPIVPALRPALLNAAELLVSLHGRDGYGQALFEMFDAGRLRLAKNPGALRDWVVSQSGWVTRYKRALATHEQRVGGLDPAHPLVRKLERDLKVARNEVAQSRAKLDELDARVSTFEGLADVVRSSVVPLDLIPYEPATHRGGHAVDFVAALNDQHADEEIRGPATWGLERFNFDVFCLRLERWARLVIEYATEHLPQHRVERLHVFSLGDALHGDIHDAKHRNSFGNTIRAAVAVADAQSEAIAQILERVPYVNVVGVSGNHPRTTVRKDYVDPHDNFDFMVLALMSARLSRYIAEGRLDVHAPRAWSALVDVRGKLNVLNHGDDVRGTWGIPWYGFQKREARVQALTARKNARADFFWYGHYHTDVGRTEAGSRSIHSGAFTLTDAYTMNAVTVGGEPMQALVVLDDHPSMRSRLLEAPIWLRDPDAERDYWAGRRAPIFGRSGALRALGVSDRMSTRGALPVIRARK